jgi:ABC-2 type transport system ATP-binding protein
MGLIGENGAGKSTTIKMIFESVRRDGGEILLFGQPVEMAPKSLKESIGAVFEESCFPEYLTLQNVGVILKNIYKTWDQKAFDGYADRFSLPKKRAIKDFSRGMRMKLSIAAALSHNARLLILDEATSGLDPIMRDEMLDVFLEFIQDESHAILISSHILSDLEKICDYIAFIHRGRLLFSEKKDDLLEAYGVFKGTQEEFDRLPPAAVVGYRRHSFGVEALVRRAQTGPHTAVDPASIEEIMLYYVKENGR